MASAAISGAIALMRRVREGAEHEPAQARVAWRLEFQHRMRLDRVEGREVVGEGDRLDRLAAEPAVLEEGRDGAVADRHRQPVILPEEQVARRAGAVVERVGVLHEGGIGRRLAERGHGGVPERRDREMTRGCRPRQCRRRKTRPRGPRLCTGCVAFRPLRPVRPPRGARSPRATARPRCARPWRRIPSGPSPRARSDRCPRR
jgi:hypothetical protein